MTPEREAFHDELKQFAALLPDGAVVYDIGRTHAHEYRDWFPRQLYVSIDRLPKAEPGILCDVEREADRHAESADALVCNGVTESASDPFALVRGCLQLLRPGGRALFGIRLVGYPISPKHDLTRFTHAGACHLIDHAGFRRLTSFITENATYCLIVCDRC